MGLYHYTVDLSWNGPGSPGVNVWDIRTVDEAPTDQLQEAVDALRDFYTTLAGGPILAGPYSMTGQDQAVEITTRDVRPVTGWATNTGVGDDVYSGLNQMIVTLRTSSATRRGRGRKFIGPVASQTLDVDGTPTSGSVAALQAACDTLLAASTGIGEWSIGVYSGVDGLFRDVTQMQARNYFAALRSRRD